ncbi:peptidylprolyl isomerase SurA [Grimontia hollisae]|uniref:Chaperone SurA n=3 Tax=Grimontia hollisae TaxID=673 RepID=D0I8H0_GRIHO|nr:peptidylprolyl isomerase SurA [Grimontia hollisae]AMG30951.1 peptidylprolyl isomerase SurA [Grimontia hollisae]EEY72939.1 peptidyl-prolyl cis-trans isomerase SurA [Grimontia hollisae CIP 101886]STO47035.1 Peptidyl-prolyl cis-trans isomerase surA [Grimontia hollisae]STO56135.1 Peptidyl-prolyl cis-trans isomerase surA [Grimontia hollisae]
MKKWTKVLLAAAISASSLSVSASPAELDRVVAVVNDGVILSSDIDALEKTVALNADQANLPPKDVLEQQILDQLILEELQLQEAKRLGIRIDDTRLEQAINSIAKERNLSVSQLQERLKRNGISWSSYRDQIRREMTISEARNAQVRRRISILPQEVESLASQLNAKNLENVEYRLSHIQLRLNEGAEKEEREIVAETANRLVKELKDGRDFAALALANSKGPKALQGGDWGWMRLEEMPTIFADQIKNNGKGAIIGPFRSGVGYHILKITDVKGLKSVAVTEVKARHILIKPSIVLSDDGAKRQLNQMIAQIKKGEKSFEDLAKQYSADPGSAVKGGDLGWQTSELYVPEFKDKVDTLPEGEISEPFKTVHGWHIVQVLDRRQADRTDTAMQNRAYGMLLNRKFNEEVQAWLQELRAGAYVEQVGSLNEES